MAVLMGPQEVAAFLERRVQLVQVLRQVLVPGVDFGNPIGTTNTAQAWTAEAAAWGFLKPGAEKLANLFNLRTVTRTVAREFGEQVRFEVACDVYDGDGVLLATRCGVCSSDEEKYRGRKGWKSKSQLEKLGLSPEGRKSEEREGRGGSKYLVYEVDLAPDDLAQTIHGMAAKRAMVDAVEAALGLSGILAEAALQAPTRPKIEQKAPALALVPQVKAEPAPPAEVPQAPAPSDENRCAKCGTEVRSGVAEFSKKHFGKVLCMGACREGEPKLAELRLRAGGAQ